MTTETRRLHLGELLIDIAIVVGSALYVHAAGAYPPQGRQIPLVVGWLAIVLGGLHLVGHVVPALWNVTHDRAAGAKSPSGKTRTAVATDMSQADALAAAADSGVADTASEAVQDDSGDVVEPQVPPAPPTGLKTAWGDPKQVALAMAWSVGLLVAVYLVGFAVALPVFFLAYFGVLRAWRTAVISAVVMWGLAEGLFVYALSVPLPHGVFW